MSSKKIIIEINKNIIELTKIKNSFLIFHRVTYLKDIKEITEFIKDINEKNLKSYNNEETKTEIRKLKKHENICDKVDNVKEFILFKVIYDKAFGNDQAKRFAEVIFKLTDIKALLDGNAKIEEIYEKNKKFLIK